MNACPVRGARCPIAEQEKHPVLYKYIVVFLSTSVVSRTLRNTTALLGSHTLKGENPMSIEETNKDIVRRLFEGTLTQEEVLSPNFVDHNIGPGYQGGDHREYYKQVRDESMAAFSDSHRTLHHLIAEGDMVVLHGTTTGTHTGLWRGKPPTGQQVSFCMISIYRLADGKIVESWDDMGLCTTLEQLLAMPR
jgi:predicted ester cyclase